MKTIICKNGQVNPIRIKFLKNLSRKNRLHIQGSRSKHEHYSQALPYHNMSCNYHSPIKVNDFK